MAEWTKEKISSRSTDEIKSLRENAANMDRQDIVGLCDQELADRKPPRVRKSTHHANQNHLSQYVCEFHFVCPKELGVTRNPDGTIWTGTWVVAEENAKTSVKYGATVALHTSKAEASYLQGTIKDWRKGPRERQYSGEQTTQTDEGIDFLIQLSDAPMPWKGYATGEKGYAWAPLPI